MGGEQVDQKPGVHAIQPSWHHTHSYAAGSTFKFIHFLLNFQWPSMLPWRLVVHSIAHIID